MTKLRQLFLRSNNFFGKIPLSFLYLKELEVLDLRDNSLSKKIPNFISNLSNITSLSLSNKYTGSIPSSMQKLVRLETLQLENNLLIGKIPSWLFNIKGMKHLFLGGNNLIWNSDAKIEPTCILSQLCMKSCGLAGEIPYWISKLKTLDFWT